MSVCLDKPKQSCPVLSMWSSSGDSYCSTFCFVLHQEEKDSPERDFPAADDIAAAADDDDDQFAKTNKISDFFHFVVW